MPPNPFNQPKIVSVDSFLRTSNNASNSGNGMWNSYTITPYVPLRKVKKIQMIKAVVPNVQLPLDDNKDLMFFYHKLTTGTPTPVSSNLKCVRLYPSQYQPAGGYTTFTRNKYVGNGTDLATLLNLAASTSGDNLTYNPIWCNNDGTFAYDTATNKMTFAGKDTTSGTSYCIAAYDSPVVAAYLATNVITLNALNGNTTQKYLPNFTMNLKLGYALSYLTVPPFSNSPITGCANLTGVGIAAPTAIPVDSYLNLVPSSAIYVFANWAGSAGQSGVGNRNLLGVIPNTVPPFGVITYQEQGNAPFLTSVLDDIYDLTIELRNDANQPYYLPDSASVNILLGLMYED
jgi:hypothetical protein